MIYMKRRLDKLQSIKSIYNDTRIWYRYPIFVAESFLDHHSYLLFHKNRRLKQIFFSHKRLLEIWQVGWWKIKSFLPKHLIQFFCCRIFFAASFSNIASWNRRLRKVFVKKDFKKYDKWDHESTKVFLKKFLQKFSSEKS